MRPPSRETSRYCWPLAQDACPVHAYAVALLKLLQGLGGVISSWAEMTTRR
jgi:hypothetical protein